MMRGMPSRFGSRGAVALVLATLTSGIGACAPGPPVRPSTIPAATAPASRPSAVAPTQTAVPAAPAAEPTDSPAPTVPAGPAAEVYRTWTLTEMPNPLPQTYGGNVPDDIAWFKGGLVAVGGVNAGCCDAGFSTDTRAVVWRSLDGVGWELAPDSDVFDLGHMNAVAADDERIVAVGHLNFEAQASPGSLDPVGAAWVSDDGATWLLLTDVPQLRDIIATDDGFLAVENAGRAPAIWRSPDGRQWDRVAAGSELGNGVIYRLIESEDGFVAVGTSVNIAVERGSQDAVVWRSSNGRDWTRIWNQGGLGDGSILDVAVRDGRYVAVGAGPGPGDAIWVSDDGETWQRNVDQVISQRGLEVFGVVAGLDGFIATGARPGPGGFRVLGAWTSADGLAWGSVPQQAGIEGAPYLVAGIGAEDGAIFAVGSRWDDGVGNVPVAWRIR